MTGTRCGFDGLAFPFVLALFNFQRLAQVAVTALIAQ
jgi:hypothetical protein